MGQTLSEPITSKDTKLLSSKEYLVGASSMQGWRISILRNMVYSLSGFDFTG